MAKRERDFDEFEDMRFCCLWSFSFCFVRLSMPFFCRIARRLALTLRFDLAVVVHIRHVHVSLQPTYIRTYVHVHVRGSS